jgi:glucose/arabinose dehydrogenase
VASVRYPLGAAVAAAILALLGLGTLLAQRSGGDMRAAAATDGGTGETDGEVLAPVDLAREQPVAPSRSAEAMRLDLPPVDAAGAAATGTAPATTTAPEIASDAATAPASPLLVPAGFSAELYADGLAGARALAVSPAGTLFVGSRFDRVHAIVDDDRDGVADRVTTVARRLDAPAGVAFFHGALWVVEPERVLRFDDIDSRLDLPPDPVVVSEALPRQRIHRLRTGRFGPDGVLYVAIAAPCDACRRDELVFATLSRFRTDFASGLEPFAEGVRSSFGFDWHPQTDELWFVDQGRSGMPDEIDRASRIGLHFGFPWCYGAGRYDERLREQTHTRCDFFVPPEAELPVDTGAMGMRFYDGAMLAGLQGAIVVAEGGPEDEPARGEPRVAIVRPAANGTASHEALVTGWVDAASGEAWGRPVDVEQLFDGALAVSDERSGAVWRVAYGE